VYCVLFARFAPLAARQAFLQLASGSAVAVCVFLAFVLVFVPVPERAALTGLVTVCTQPRQRCELYCS
jgi:hypothetical protein